MRTIKVKGTAKGNYPVDTITISMVIRAEDMDSSKSLKTIDKVFTELKSLFGSELKTTSYQVNPRYEYDQNNKRTFLGFEAFHSTKLQLKNDAQKLSSVLEQINEIDYPIEFNVSYEATQIDHDELRRIAVMDAMHQAEVISKAANVKIKEIVEVSAFDNYEPVAMLSKSRASFESMDFEEFSAQLTLNVIFEIE